MQFNNIEQTIKNKLCKAGARCLLNGKWLKIPFNIDFGKLKSLEVRFSMRKESLLLKLPLNITDDLAFFYGLCLGSGSRKSDNTLYIKIDMSQLDIVRKICTNYGFSISPKLSKKERKKANTADAKKKMFKTYKVKIPAVIYNYLKVLGYNLLRPRIPSMFTDKQKRIAVSGYLNSQKSFIRSHGLYTNEWFIRTPPKPSKFTICLSELLKEYAPKFKKIGNSTYLVIKTDLTPQLAHAFNITKLQIFYRVKLLELCSTYPHLHKTISMNELDVFTKTLLGCLYYQFYIEEKEEIEFTVLEEIFHKMNNDLRRSLYSLQEKRLIQFFKDDTNKDYIAPSMAGGLKVKKRIKNKISRLEAKLEAKDEIYFRCQKCNTTSNYLSIISGENISCPHCKHEQLVERPRSSLIHSSKIFQHRLDVFNDSFSNFPFS